MIIVHGCIGLLLGWIYAYAMLRPFITNSRPPGRGMIRWLFLLRLTVAGVIIWVVLYFGMEPAAVLPCVLFGYATRTALYIRRVPVI